MAPSSCFGPHYEAGFAGSVREFVRVHNRRLSPKAREGERWVRVQPWSELELDSAGKDARLIKFFRAGSEVIVTEVLPRNGLLEIDCGGDKLLIEPEEFLSSWIRIVSGEEWRRGPRPSPGPCTSGRRSPGST